MQRRVRLQGGEWTEFSYYAKILCDHRVWSTLWRRLWTTHVATYKMLQRPVPRRLCPGYLLHSSVKIKNTEKNRHSLHWPQNKWLRSKKDSALLSLDFTKNIPIARKHLPLMVQLPIIFPSRKAEGPMEGHQKRLAPGFPSIQLPAREHDVE